MRNKAAKLGANYIQLITNRAGVTGSASGGLGEYGDNQLNFGKIMFEVRDKKWYYHQMWRAHVRFQMYSRYKNSLDISIAAASNNNDIDEVKRLQKLQQSYIKIATESLEKAIQFLDLAEYFGHPKAATFRELDKLPAYQQPISIAIEPIATVEHDEVDWNKSTICAIM